MTKPPRRPLYHDYQPPDLHRAGVSLRRGFALGPADTRDEERLRRLLADEPPVSDPDGEEVTRFQPGRRLE